MQLTLLTLFWHPPSLFRHCWGNKLLVGISIWALYSIQASGDSALYRDKNTVHIPSASPSSQCWVCLSNYSAKPYARRNVVHRHSFQSSSLLTDQAWWPHILDRVLPLLFYLCHLSQANPAHKLPVNTLSASWRPRAWLGKKKELLQKEGDSMFLTV